MIIKKAYRETEVLKRKLKPISKKKKKLAHYTKKEYKMKTQPAINNFNKGYYGSIHK